MSYLRGKTAEQAMAEQLKLFGSSRTQQSILEEAHSLVIGARARDYEPPSVNFQRICAIWSVILKREVTMDEFVLCMIAVKIARHVGVEKRDNLVDIVGYIDALDIAKQ